MRRKNPSPSSDRPSHSPAAKMAAPARILIVDDDVGLVEALATALQFHYDVLTAYSGKAAFEALAQHPVDLVILDHRLPDMEGLVVLHFLKRLFSDVPVLYMTAYGSEDLAVEFQDAGGRKYFRKPFDIPALLARVDAYVAARRQRRGARRPILEAQASAPAADRNGSPDLRIARARAYIEANLHRRLRVQDVARAAGLSKSLLARMFTQDTGATVKRFILRRRLANGIALLFDLSLSIKEVAALAGFTDPGNFARIFQKTTGYTPTEFRASLRAALAPDR